MGRCVAVWLLGEAIGAFSFWYGSCLMIDTQADGTDSLVSVPVDPRSLYGTNDDHKHSPRSAKVLRERASLFRFPKGRHRHSDELNA